MSAQQAVDGRPVIRHGVEAVDDLLTDAGMDRVAEVHASFVGRGAQALRVVRSCWRPPLRMPGRAVMAGCNASVLDRTPEYVCSTRRVGLRVTAMANLGASAGWGLVV